MASGLRVGPSKVLTTLVCVAESSLRNGPPALLATTTRRAFSALTHRAPLSASAAPLLLASWGPAAVASDAAPIVPSAAVDRSRLPILRTKRRNMMAVAINQLVFRACGRTRRPPRSATRGTRRMAYAVWVEAACGRTNLAEATSLSKIIVYIQ